MHPQPELESLLLSPPTFCSSTAPVPALPDIRAGLP